MAQRQLRGFIEGLAEQHSCDEQVLDVIETMAQHLTGEQIEAVIKDLAARNVVEPVQVRPHEWQRQVLLNNHGAVIINNSGRSLSASEGLVLVKDYADLQRLCTQLGFTYADQPSDKVTSIKRATDCEHTKREALVLELTFRSDGCYLLDGNELVDDSYESLTKELVNFDPYNKGTVAYP